MAIHYEQKPCAVWLYFRGHWVVLVQWILRHGTLFAVSQTIIRNNLRYSEPLQLSSVVSRPSSVARRHTHLDSRLLQTPKSKTALQRVRVRALVFGPCAQADI